MYKAQVMIWNITRKGVNVMKYKGLQIFVFAFVAVLFSYGSASGQIVNAAKDAADKAKEVTKKTGVVVTDGLEKIADKTKDATVDGTKKAAKTTKNFGNKSVEVTENIAEGTVREGKFYTVKTWDGTKWVSKQVWFASKKTADKTKDVVVGDEDQN